MSDSLLNAPPIGPKTAARVWLPFLAVTLIWGSTWLVITGQLGVVPPSWSVSYRFLLGSVAMFAFATWSRTSLRMDARDHLFVIALGMAQFVLNFNLVYRAEMFVTSGLVAVVFALLIVPNAIGARLLFGQGLSRPFLAGSLVAMCGVALLFAHELRSDAAATVDTALGIGLTMIGVLAASTANLMQASQRAHRMAMPTMLAWAMLYGGLIDAAYAWITSGPPVFEWSAAYIAGLLYLGLVASAFAFGLYFGLIRRIGPARAAYSSVIIPVLAMTLSTIFENYVWSWTAGLGAALVLGGLVIALRARNPAR